MMELFPEIEWKEISNKREPESLEEIFDMLFPLQDSEKNIDMDTFLEDRRVLHYFAKKLISIPFKERSEDKFDLLSYTLFTATLFALNEDYQEAFCILEWGLINRFIKMNNTSEDLFHICIFATVLYYFVKNQNDELSQEDIEIFANGTFLKITDQFYFDIEWNLFNHVWNVNVPIAEFFGWIFEVVNRNSVKIADEMDLNEEGIVESYLIQFINFCKMLYIGESKILQDGLAALYEKLDHPFLKRSCELFRKDYKAPTQFKKYIKKIRKDTLERYETILKSYLDDILCSVSKENMYLFLSEINNKRYLVPLLDVINNEKYFGRVLKMLVQLKGNDGSILAMTIFNEWLKPEVKEKVIQIEPFYMAYIYKANGYFSQAAELYETMIKKEPENVAVLNNLSVIYYENIKDYDKALGLLKKGEQINPEDTHIQNNLKAVLELLEKEKLRSKELKDRYFKKINKLQRSILFAIYKLSSDGMVTDDLIQSVTKISDNRFFKTNVNKLLELELISYNHEKGYVIEPIIYELVHDFINPKIEREVVRASPNCFYRPIFYHESEIKLYQALIELFPQQLVFPNMDLKTIIDVDKVKAFLDADVIDYMFKAHVDFAIISNTTYLPILCIEKDSDYQDGGYAAQNVVKKNMIFSTSGLPLIRIRFTPAMDNDRLKEEVKQATKEFLLQTQKENDKNDILKEFDLKRFGVFINLPSKEEIESKWKSIVGETIFTETKDIMIDGMNSVVQIKLSKSVEQVIEFGKESIKAKIYQDFPALNSVQFFFV